MLRSVRGSLCPPCGSYYTPAIHTHARAGHVSGRAVDLVRSFELEAKTARAQRRTGTARLPYDTTPDAAPPDRSPSRRVARPVLCGGRRARGARSRYTRHRIQLYLSAGRRQTTHVAVGPMCHAHTHVASDTQKCPAARAIGSRVYVVSFVLPVGRATTATLI